VEDGGQDGDEFFAVFRSDHSCQAGLHLVD
jgi:hypothetical protein